MRRYILAVALMAALGACAGGESRPAPEGKVLGSDGAGSNLERFEVRQQGRLMTVQVYNRGGSARTVAVSARSVRALDRADGQLALDVAARAGTQIDCSGKPLRVLAKTGIFQEQGRRSAFTNGEAAWIFQGQCG